jgi:hypothetical protein
MGEVKVETFWDKVIKWGGRICLTIALFQWLQIAYIIGHHYGKEEQKQLEQQRIDTCGV